MKYLLDTNVLSELRKPERTADPRVRAWVAARKPSHLFLSVITVLEIEIGIARLERKDRRQAQAIRAWLDEEVLDSFSGRLLPIDLAVARRTAHLHVPDPSPERDALIGATAIEHDLAVVTRNVSDFEGVGVAVIDPWS
ncbi:PIN domain-containing protein [Naumannella huperziae]